MTFSSLTFLFVFFPVTFLLYALIRNHTARNFILAAASLVFYAFGEPVAVMIMLISIVLNYLFGRGAAGTKWDKPAVVLAVVLNIGLLAAYKYTGFLVEIFDGITGLSVPVPHIRLPIGISFFTFQGLSYVVDVYRDKKNVQRSLFSVLLYISFFPQLIAGPIVRYSDIAAQIQEREFSFDRISRGVCRFLFGLAKKVLLANQMGLLADKVFSFGCGQLATDTAWIGAVCYTLQIFFDFCGYSDMAIGLGCVFGFDFKENFNYPFISGSIQEFWRRWHISLSNPQQVDRLLPDRALARRQLHLHSLGPLARPLADAGDLSDRAHQEEVVQAHRPRLHDARRDPGLRPLPGGYPGPGLRRHRRHVLAHGGDPGGHPRDPVSVESPLLPELRLLPAAVHADFPRFPPKGGTNGKDRRLQLRGLRGLPGPVCAVGPHPGVQQL